MARCLVVQHLAPESPFAVGDALMAAGAEVEICRVFAGDVVPADATGLDGLVVMGGPMSADADDGFPTRVAELELIARAVADGVPTLGVCLGAQLLAASGGAAVYRGAAGPEIGWEEVDLAPPCDADALFADLPSRITVLQWHGDTFDLPDGALRLVAGQRYANQAFRLGPSAWGLQFHLEVTSEAVEGFLVAFGDEVEGVEDLQRIRNEMPDALRRLAPTRDLVCARFAALVTARPFAVPASAHR